MNRQEILIAVYASNIIPLTRQQIKDAAYPFTFPPSNFPPVPLYAINRAMMEILPDAAAMADYRRYIETIRDLLSSGF